MLENNGIDAGGSPTKTIVTYLPPAHKPITKYETVVKHLHLVQEMAHHVNMPAYVLLTRDVSAAAKTYHVLWNLPDEFENVIIYLGDFYLFQENFGIMGQFTSGSRFEDKVYQESYVADIFQMRWNDYWAYLSDSLWIHQSCILFQHNCLSISVIHTNLKT